MPKGKGKSAPKSGRSAPKAAWKAASKGASKRPSKPPRSKATGRENRGHRMAGALQTAQAAARAEAAREMAYATATIDQARAWAVNQALMHIAMPATGREVNQLPLKGPWESAGGRPLRGRSGER